MNSKKRLPGSTKLTDVLKEHTVSLTNTRPTKTSPKAFRTTLEETRQLLDTHQDELGDYEIKLRVISENSATIDFFSFADALVNTDTLVKGRRLPATNNKDLNVCDICDERLSCLVVPAYEYDGKCGQDDEVRHEIVSKVVEKFNLHYPMEKTIALFKKSGFNYSVLGDVEIDNVLEKDGVSVFFN